MFENLPLIIAITAVLTGVVGFAWILYRVYEALVRRALHKRYADLEVRVIPQSGDVVLRYHTYHGIFVWFTPTVHHVALSPQNAHKLLGRLLRFNLTWGLVSYARLFIPPLAIWNYFAQLRSIAMQEGEGRMATAKSEIIPESTRIEDLPVGQVAPSTKISLPDEMETGGPTSEWLPPSPQPPAVPDDDFQIPQMADVRLNRSLFMRPFGWIAAGLAVVFGSITVVSLFNGEYEVIFGGILVTLILGGVEYNYI
jgi:hypothetical protein